MKKNRAGLLVALGICLGSAMLLAILGALNYSGFCLSKGKYLSDRELLEANFENGGPISFRLTIDGEEKTLVQKTKYSDFDDFLSKHPNCCMVDPPEGSDLAPPRFSWRIQGRDRIKTLRFTYQEEFVDSEGNVITHDIRGYTRLTNCGKKRW